MGNYSTSDGFQKTYTTKDAVILSGASLSSAIDLEQLNITGFQIPASWTAAKLTFQASFDGTTYGDVQDSSGNEIQATVAAGKFIGVNLSELSGIRFLKVRSGTSGTPVNQGADRTISIVLTNNAEASAGGGTTAAVSTIADGADVAEGAVADAAVAAGAAGTVSAKLRRLTTDLDAVKTSAANIPASPATTAKQDTGNTSLASIDGKIPASPATTAKQDTGNTSLGNIDTNAGATSDAAVAAGATGSISAKLRRLTTDLDAVKTSVAAIPASPATSGKQDTGNTSLGNIDTNAGATTDAAVVSDTNGTLSAKLRGLVKIFADIWNSTIHAFRVIAKLDTTGGWTPFKFISAASNNAQVIKASTGQLGGLQVFNNSANIAYLKFYDKASTPNPASDTPVKTLGIPATSGSTGSGFTIGRGVIGTQFSTGIAVALVGAIGDTDNTSVAANAYVINGEYN